MTEAADSPVNLRDYKQPKLLPDLLCETGMLLPSSGSWRPRRSDAMPVLSQSNVASAASSSYISAAIWFEGKPASSRIGGDPEVRSSPTDHAHRRVTDTPPLSVACKSDLCVHSGGRVKPEAVNTGLKNKQTNKTTRTHTRTSSEPCVVIDTGCSLMSDAFRGYKDGGEQGFNNPNKSLG